MFCSCAFLPTNPNIRDSTVMPAQKYITGFVWSTSLSGYMAYLSIAALTLTLTLTVTD